MNQLYFGDNLDVLRKDIPDDSVDLIYLDPPFNSKRDYNLLFKSPKGHDSDAQIMAFEDSWHWGEQAEREFAEIMHQPNTDVSEIMQAFRSFLKENDMLAYLTMMANRLLELHKVLKPTGSLYLHCDPTASHYLKIVLDGVFGKENYRTEISWKRSSAHSDAKQGRTQYGNIRDSIFFYTNSKNWKWNQLHTPYNPEYIESMYRYKEDGTGRIYRLDNLTGPGGAGKGNPAYEVMGVTRYWRYSKKKMKELIKQGRIIQTKPGGVPAYKRYLDEMPGVALQNDWQDISPTSGNEYLGYPTQKPLALLERIIMASSNEGDTVLDPFCGCGTTVAAAQKLNRKWLGVDISHLAVRLVLKRLKDTYKEDYKEILKNIDIDGFPRDIASARELALTERGRIKFQDWVVEVLIGGISNPKKSGEGGEDGHVTFPVSPKKSGVGIVEVKSGNANVASLRSFITSVKQKKADMGVFACFDEKITSGMRREAKEEGTLPNFSSVDRIQILGIEELMNGKEVQLPGHGDFNHFRSAARYKEDLHENGELF